MLGTIDYFLRDMSKGVARIQQGEVPSGSGAAIPTPGIDQTKFFFLPGRTGGQVAQSVDANAILRLNLPTAGAVATGAVGTPYESFSIANAVLADILPYIFDNVTTDIAIRPKSTAGGLQVIPVDGTSGIRLLATANRAFLQVGRKDSTNKVQESSVTIGGQGATVAQRMATEVQFLAASNSGTVGQNGVAVNTQTVRMAVNADPFDFSSVAATAQQDSLYIAPLNTGSNAPLIVESTGARNTVEVRGTPTGSTPNKAIGSIEWSLSTGPTVATWRNAGTKQFDIRNNASSDMSIKSGGVSGAEMLRMRIVTAFADTVLSQTLEIGDVGNGADSPSTLTNRDVVVASSNGNALARLGISATSTVLGPATPGVLPAPTASRILTMVDSSGNVLAGYASDGSLFFRASEKIDATAQGADVVTTTLSSTAGFYHVMALLETTTGDGAAGTVTLTISWTDDLGATTALISGLTLTATGRGTPINVPLYVASGNLTYAVSHTGSYGTAKYALRIRCIPLG